MASLNGENRIIFENIDTIVSEIRSTVDSNGSGRYSRVSEILSMHSVRD